MNNEDAEGHARSQVSHEAIIDHFRNRPLQGHGQRFHHSVYHLVRLVLEHRDFHSLESLMEYCGNYDNLRPWLLHEADRVMFSDELIQGLCDMVSKTRGSPPSGSKLE